MVRLMMILLGGDYLRSRWRSLMAAACAGMLAGVFLVVDALDNILLFPVTGFAALLLLEGLGTLAVAWLGTGGQRTLRYLKGGAVTLAALMILSGHQHANLALGLIFGTVFLLGGVLQIAAARLIRYRNWRLAVAGGVFQVAMAIMFYEPYPTHYAGTVPYALGLALLVGGWNLALLAGRVRRFAGDAATGADASREEQAQPLEWDGPPDSDEHALTVHIWTPVGSSKAEVRRRLLVDRYIAAVDRNGVVSTGHAALETPEGIYISLYPAADIDHSPEDIAQVLRAGPENDMPGVFQASYAQESRAWCPSNVQVRIRNYDPERLSRHWASWRQEPTYNLTHRNCSTTVARALEAALDGALARVWRGSQGWKPLLWLLFTPELWVAAQIRRRAVTMTWTPGLVMDYARALSMLADPRPWGWVKMARLALRKMGRMRRRWREEKGGRGENRG